MVKVNIFKDGEDNCTLLSLVLEIGGGVFFKNSCPTPKR